MSKVFRDGVDFLRGLAQTFRIVFAKEIPGQGTLVFCNIGEADINVGDDLFVFTSSDLPEESQINAVCTRIKQIGPFAEILLRGVREDQIIGFSSIGLSYVPGVKAHDE